MKRSGTLALASACLGCRNIRSGPSQNVSTASLSQVWSIGCRTGPIGLRQAEKFGSTASSRLFDCRVVSLGLACPETSPSYQCFEIWPKCCCTGLSWYTWTTKHQTDAGYVDLHDCGIVMRARAVLEHRSRIIASKLAYWLLYWPLLGYLDCENPK